MVLSRKVNASTDTILCGFEKFIVFFVLFFCLLFLMKKKALSLTMLKSSFSPTKISFPSLILLEREKKILAVCFSPLNYLWTGGSASHSV